MAVVLRTNYGFNRPLRDPVKAMNRCHESAQVQEDILRKRKITMSLVELCSQFMESVWPSKICKLPFKQFVVEVLKRSRVPVTVLQVALCYISRIKPIIMQMRAEGKEVPLRLACGRRVLVAALQIASKYVQDRSYSVSIWSKISGLSAKDLTANEIALMQVLDWNMFVSFEAYTKSCRWMNVSLDKSLNDKLRKESNYFESEVNIWNSN